MKKEKKVRTYQRRTKTGKLVTVKQHTAKYDAAEKAKEALKKKGAGDELSAKKKAKPVSSAGELDFTQADFKAWYHWDQENDPKNPAALKVEKALKAKMGARGYRKFFNDMSDSYSARGHLKAYKECQSCGDKSESKSTKTTKVKEPKTSKSEASPKKSVDTPKSSGKTPSKVAERYANEAGEEKVIAFMESNYRCTYNKKTGKFDFDGANFGRGHTLKSRSRTMEDARKAYAEKLQTYNELKAKDDPYIKNHIRNAKRQGWFINIPSKELADKSSSKASKSSEKEPTKTEAKSSPKSSGKTTKTSSASSWMKESPIKLRQEGSRVVGEYSQKGQEPWRVQVNRDRKGNFRVVAIQRLTGNTRKFEVSTLKNLDKHLKQEISPRRKMTSKLGPDGEMSYGSTPIRSKALDKERVK